MVTNKGGGIGSAAAMPPSSSVGDEKQHLEETRAHPRFSSPTKIIIHKFKKILKRRSPGWAKLGARARRTGFRQCLPIIIA